MDVVLLLLSTFSDTRFSFLSSLQLREEVRFAYLQIKTLCANIRESEASHTATSRRSKSPLKAKKRRRHSSDSLMTNSSGSSNKGMSSASSSCSSEDYVNFNPASKISGLLTDVVAELQTLTKNYFSRRGRRRSCAKCGGSEVGNGGRSGRSSSAESAVVLDEDDDSTHAIRLHSTEEQYEDIQIQLKQFEIDMKNKNNEINRLQNKVLMLLSSHVSVIFNQLFVVS